MNKLFLAGVVLATSGGIAGCATQSTKNLASSAGDADESGRESRVSHLSSWSLAGRLSITDGKTGGPTDFSWRQNGDTFDLAMDAPGVAVQLHEGAEGAVVTGVKGGPCYGTDAESIMRQQLGWDVPVKDLRAWVLGLRAPGEEAQVHLGANQLPDQLTQDGWVVSYRSWYTDRSPPLPKIVFAEKYPYKIRLSITSWTVR